MCNLSPSIRLHTNKPRQRARPRSPGTKIIRIALRPLHNPLQISQVIKPLDLKPSEIILVRIPLDLHTPIANLHPSKPLSSIPIFHHLEHISIRLPNTQTRAHTRSLDLYERVLVLISHPDTRVAAALVKHDCFHCTCSSVLHHVKPLAFEAGSDGDAEVFSGDPLVKVVLSVAGVHGEKDISRAGGADHG